MSTRLSNPLRLIETLRPELLKPLIRVLRLISQLNLTLEFGNIIPRLIIQSILLIRSIADIVWNGLNIVSDLLVTDAGDVVDLSVLESELVAEVGVNLELVSMMTCVDSGGLTMPIRRPSLATTFWMVALRFAWLRQLPHDW
jgi:hypothetical protein